MAHEFDDGALIKSSVKKILKILWDGEMMNV